MSWKRNVILLIALSITLILSITITMNNQITQLENDKYDELSQRIDRELNILIDEKSNALLNIALSAAENTAIKNSLINDEQITLNLTSLSHKLRDYGDFKNIWFHIVKANGTSHYRSWTKKRGDDITKVRLDIVEFIKKPEVKSVISVGIFDLTFKTMVPIYENKKFIGIFEAIAKFNSITTNMQKKNYNTIIFVDKKFKQQLKKPFTKTFLDDYYVANLNADKKALAFIKEKTLESFIDSNEKYFIFEHDNYFVSLFRLNDIQGSKMAYFLTFKNLSDIKTNDIEQIRKEFIFILIIIILIILGIFYYIYHQRYKNLMIDLNRELEKQVEEKTETLNHIAMHDSLTNLPNRTLFIDRLDQDIKKAKRDQNKLAVLFLDLDKFKEVNDSLGHEAGDELLQEVAHRLSKCVRQSDTVSRFGGDEFTIYINETTEEGIVRIAEKIMLSMKKPIVLMNNSLHITFSIGISVYPHDGQYSDMLIRNADIAMYKAKNMGKDTFAFYDKQMTHEILERIDLEKNIKLALLGNEFIPYFQPQIDANTNTVIGVEALIRWDSHEFGFLSPNRFIPIAEETGLIIDVGRWMIIHSIKILNKLYLADIFKGRLSINLSLKQLEYPRFIDELKEVLKDTQYLPSLIEFEITESQIMDDPQHTIKILNQIKDLGIKISIDDFGTGYSSLSYLSTLPIDKLKIDKSFVDKITEDEESLTIIKTIIALAKSLNLELIAEGVETIEQKEILLDVGCHNIQGYYYAKPLNEEDFKNYITTS